MKETIFIEYLTIYVRERAGWVSMRPEYKTFSQTALNLGSEADTEKMLCKVPGNKLKNMEKIKKIY